jgi:hypothetical protein
MFGQTFGDQSDMRSNQSGFRNFGGDNTDEYFRNEKSKYEKFASRNKVSNTSKYARNNL